MLYSGNKPVATYELGYSHVQDYSNLNKSYTTNLDINIFLGYLKLHQTLLL